MNKGTFGFHSQRKEGDKWLGYNVVLANIYTNFKFPSNVMLQKKPSCGLNYFSMQFMQELYIYSIIIFQLTTQ